MRIYRFGGCSKKIDHQPRQAPFRCMSGHVRGWWGLERSANPLGAQVTPPYEYKKKMYGTLKIRGFKTILQCAKMKDQKEGIL